MTPDQIKTALAREIEVTMNAHRDLDDPSDVIAAAVLELVKPKRLVWVDHPAVDGPVTSMAVSTMGTYFICDDTDDFTGLYCELVHQKDAKWWGDVKAATTVVCSHQHVDDHSGLQAAAQSHADAAHWANTALGELVGGV